VVLERQLRNPSCLMSNDNGGEIPSGLIDISWSSQRLTAFVTTATIFQEELQP
jgi:hypothetical protein